jgi:hypothetical protein
VTLDWVMRQMGHSSINVTVSTYGHWSREAERKQAEQPTGMGSSNSPSGSGREALVGRQWPSP